MAGGLILETTFLVDLERETVRGERGPAQAFLERRSGERLFITATVAGELAAGPRLDDRQTWEALIAPFRVLEINAETCWRYGRAYRFLRDNGVLIGANDLWIAATALTHQLPVVTRNLVHYRRVPDLEVIEYR